MVYFETEEVQNPIEDTREYNQWIEQVVQLLGYRLGRVQYLFCNDKKILAINQQFLQHDYYTDIITFDYTQKNTISGDIFVSTETVATNAEKNNTTQQQEMERVIIHGILHLCGKKDKSEEEEKTMRYEENKALQLLQEMREKSIKKQKNENNH